jgi:cytochrome P450
MNNTILSWNGTDHREIYNRQLKENPLYYDPNLKAWVVYSYEYCMAVLSNTDAHVPEPVIDGNSLLNDRAKLLIRDMARLSNDHQHETARAAAMMIFQKINQVDIHALLKSLLTMTDSHNFDWVEVIARRLPAQVILKGLNFYETDSAYVITNLASLVRVMSPVKTAVDAKIVNATVSRVYEITERYIISSGLVKEAEETNELLICNLIGLFIQCYDAGRGLLCNTLLSFAANQQQHVKRNDISYYKALVDETLRRDPPVHSTRRIATKAIRVGTQTIPAGEIVLIVLAAANLDPIAFKDADQFDPTRSNNEQHLTFGLGGHNCIAKYLCITMAAETCAFLANNYKTVGIRQKDFSYGPQLNVRLIKQLMITLI